ncbi:hypothetical protein HMI54_012106 [Coelomomyces lativittatus]|nr:hypothetical protein HMI55_003640 [Coelomomyces lativittatus]KAJ1518693.1 hypothetical protein HMI54_012106 [Coelomomyces lativittatus]
MASTDSPFTLGLKQLERSYGVTGFLKDDPTDSQVEDLGLIFTPVQLNYVFGICPKVLHWCNHLNTKVHFLIQVSYTADRKPHYAVYASKNGISQFHDFITLEPDIALQWRKASPAGLIAQFHWDPTWKTYIRDEGYAPKERMGGWRFFSLKHHRRIPDSMDYALQVRKAIESVVTLQMIFDAIPSIRHHWKLRTKSGIIPPPTSTSTSIPFSTPQAVKNTPPSNVMTPNSLSSQVAALSPVQSEIPTLASIENLPKPSTLIVEKRENREKLKIKLVRADSSTSSKSNEPLRTSPVSNPLSLSNTKSQNTDNFESSSTANDQQNGSSFAVTVPPSSSLPSTTVSSPKPSNSQTDSPSTNSSWTLSNTPDSPNFPSPNTIDNSLLSPSWTNRMPNLKSNILSSPNSSSKEKGPLTVTPPTCSTVPSFLSPFSEASLRTASSFTLSCSPPQFSSPKEASSLGLFTTLATINSPLQKTFSLSSISEIGSPAYTSTPALLPTTNFDELLPSPLIFPNPLFRSKQSPLLTSTPSSTMNAEMDITNSATAPTNLFSSSLTTSEIQPQLQSETVVCPETPSLSPSHPVPTSSPIPLNQPPSTSSSSTSSLFPHTSPASKKIKLVYTSSKSSLSNSTSVLTNEPILDSNSSSESISTTNATISPTSMLSLSSSSLTMLPAKKKSLPPPSKMTLKFLLSDPISTSSTTSRPPPPIPTTISNQISLNPVDTTTTTTNNDNTTTSPTSTSTPNSTTSTLQPESSAPMDLEYSVALWLSELNSKGHLTTEILNGNKDGNHVLLK